MPKRTHWQARSAGAAEDLNPARWASPANDRGGRPALRGLGPVTAILPNGRLVWLRMSPQLASSIETNRLSLDLQRARAERHDDLHAQHERLKRLTRRVRANFAQLSAAQVRADQQLRERVAKGDAATDQRVSRRLEPHRRRLAREIIVGRGIAKRIDRRALWDQLVVLSSLPLFAAYGQRGDPFGANNLALSVALGVWLLGDEVSEFFSTGRGPRDFTRDTDVWTYLSPFANVLSGIWLMVDRQHERMLSGAVDSFTRVMAAVPAGQPRVETYQAEVNLTELVALEHAADFQTFVKVPAQALVLDASFATQLKLPSSARIVETTALIDRGVLTVSVTVTAAEAAAAQGGVDELLTALRVAWVADTREA